MLLRFTVENMFTIKEAQTLFVTAATSCKDRVEDNTFSTGDYKGKERALKSIAIYGANASGKTNFLRSLYVMVELVRKGVANSGPLPVAPFIFVQAQDANAPSRFEIEFVLDGNKYRYGFAAVRTHIVEEWFYRKEITRKGTQELELFARWIANGKDTVEASRHLAKADRKVVEKMRADTLFLSTAASLAVPEADKVVRDFFGQIAIYSATWSLCTLTAMMMQDRQMHDRVVGFLAKTDSSIRDVVVAKREVADSVGTHEEPYPKVVLGDLEGNGPAQPIPLEQIASLGTIKAFQVAGPMFDILETGGVLVIDELDRSLHPILVRQIIRLFNDRTSNPHNAQLIFNTHDTNLLNDRVYVPEKDGYESLMRRDQIYFMERDAVLASHLYSLVEFQAVSGKKAKRGSSVEADYLNGLYGSIPYIGKLV